MTPGNNHGGTAAGTAMGTLFAFAANIQSGDMVKTAILSRIGALVSFVISLLLKWISKKIARGNR